MGEPRIVFVSREVYPFDSAGLGNYVLFTAAALASVAEVTILTSSVHERRYNELRRLGDARLPDGVRFEFVREPTPEDAWGWYTSLHRWSARAFEALCRLYPDGGPDLAEFPDYLGEGCVAAQASQTLDSRLRNTRVCVRAYTTAEMCAVLDGYLAADRETRLLCDLERYALRNCDRFLCPGGDVLATYRAFYDGLVAPAVEVNHVVARDCEPAAAPPPDGELNLLYVGRLERRKGVQNLVRAATALPGSDWSLTLIGGDTPTAPRGHSMRAQLELMVAGDPRIRILDHVPREDLGSLVAASHLCVSPSLWECWPNTVLEALDQNRPVLATPVGGHVAMVTPGDSGWLTAGNGADGLADRIEELIADPGAPGRLIAAGGPRRAFHRLTDPEPVKERYVELARGAPGRVAAGGPAGSPPLVSVIIPYFHMEDHVEETLSSIAAQTHPRIENIVVNDGSLREEDRILSELAERYPVSVVTQPNSGLGQARNLGIEVSRGRYVLPLDPDDVLLPTFVERCVAVLEQRPEIAYVTAWSEFMDEDGAPLRPGGYRPLGNTASWIENENVAGSAMAVMRRRLFDRGLRYSADLTSYEDWLLYRELSQNGHYGHVIPETLLRYRVHDRSMMRAISRRMSRRLRSELRAQAKEAEVGWVSSSV